MKKKSRFLLCLTVTIVLSLALPCLGSSVNAASVITPSIEPGTYYLTGIDLYDFLMTFYTVEIGVSDTYDDWGDNVQWLDRDTFEYQFVASDIDDNVYFTFSFPNINGVPSPIKGKYYVIRFRSDYTSKYGRPLFAFNLFQTTVYKRYNENNGDVTDGDSEPYLSVELSTNEHPKGIKFTKDIENYDYYDFPLLNQGSTVIDGKTVSPWINPSAPYQRNSLGNFKMQQHQCDFLTVDLNTVRDGYGSYEQLFDISIIYGSGQYYINGAIQFAIEPITLVVTEVYTDMTEFEENLIYPTKPDKDFTNGQQQEGLGIKDTSSEISSQLKNNSLAVDQNTARPNFDISNLIGLQGQDGLVGGLAAYRRATAVLFGNSSDYENPTMLYFLAPAIPALIVSYLLFGRKSG